MRLTIGLTLTMLFLLPMLWLLDGFLWRAFSSVPDAAALPPNHFLVIAHRGASGQAPENTFSAFRTALSMGSDMLELDVHLSADSIPVVIHDASLDRTTDGEGLVVHKTLAELQQLDAGSWFARGYTGEVIPSLQEVLDEFAPKTRLLIELKNQEDGSLYQGLAKSVVEMINRRALEDRCILQAFDSRYLHEIAALDPSIELQKLIVGTWRWPALYYDVKWGSGRPGGDTLAYTGLNPFYYNLTPQKVTALQKQGLKVYPYTVNSDKEMRRLIHLGVDGIITNYPSRLVQLRQNLASP